MSWTTLSNLDRDLREPDMIDELRSSSKRMSV